MSYKDSRQTHISQKGENARFLFDQIPNDMIIERGDMMKMSSNLCSSFVNFTRNPYVVFAAKTYS